MPSTRRRFLQTSFAAATGAALNAAASRPALRGKFLSLVPFVEEGGSPLGTVIGDGLGGRLVFDLARLTPARLKVANRDFFIRTRYPDLLRPPERWTISIGGRVAAPRELGVDELIAAMEPMGTHLLECSGNNRYRSFGLIGSADWSGVPVSRLLERVGQLEGKRVLISGFDRHSQPHPQSVMGASWIFTPEELAETGAFLALEMNGELLPREHGQPVRLVVPGWYGCTCIKWVNEITVVDDDAPATSQMREFAERTHQDGVPELARDYRPARIDLAAMPVRVERWAVPGGVLFRVIGIAWGGAQPVDRCLIRFRPSESFVAVDAFHHGDPATWSLWSHTWRPSGPGSYTIELKPADADLPARRLERGYYVRRVHLSG